MKGFRKHHQCLGFREAPGGKDQYGYNMPDRYKCDSCRAVIHHLNED